MIAWGIESLIASALLMLLVLAVRGRVAAAFGPRIAYMLWLLPLARLLLPRLPSLGPRAVALPAIELPPVGGPSPFLPRPELLMAPTRMPDLPPPLPGFHWPLLLVGVWLGGAVIHFLWQIGVYRRFLSLSLSGARLLCRTCGIAVHHGPNVSGPVAAGIFHRRILLPRDFETRYSPVERRLVLAHEVAHHVRGDLIANVAALAVLSLHWFNPLAYRAYRAFRADQELACDATVLREEPGEMRPIYGAALLKSLNAATPAAACAIGGAAMLKQRVRMLGAPRLSRMRRVAGGAIVAVAIVQGLWLTASGGAAVASRMGPAAIPAIMPPVKVAAADPMITPGTVATAAVPATPRPHRAPVVRRPALDDSEDLMPIAPLAPVATPAPPAPLSPPAPPAAEAPPGGSAVEALAKAREQVASQREVAAQIREQLAAADIEGTVQRAMAQARLAVAAACGENHRACTDRAAIRAQVAASLRSARVSMRAADRALIEQDRAVRQIDRAIEKMERQQDR